MCIRSNMVRLEYNVQNKQLNEKYVTIYELAEYSFFFFFFVGYYDIWSILKKLAHHMDTIL